MDRVRVPRCVAMVITSCQLIQMVTGCFVNYTAYTFKTKGRRSRPNPSLGLFVGCAEGKTKLDTIDFD